MTEPENNPTKLTSKKKAYVAGMSAGIFLFLGATLVGLLVSIYGTSSSFKAVEGDAIAPEDKARYLADGISDSMNAVVIGGGVSLFGAVLFAVCLALFLKSGSTDRVQDKAR